MQAQNMVDITGFKEWVLGNVSPDDPLYKLMETKENAITTTEASYLTSTIFKLIEVAKIKK
ncbi:MAG: hypothetical protein JRN15_04120 [Nitrososphaerota archaeon]|nr:hypothetical protein [Nitrososphaerota archaeon]